MKKHLNGQDIEMTAEEVSQRETDEAKAVEEETQRQADKEAKDSLKASAKAKLIAGEALTEEEADTIVL